MKKSNKLSLCMIVKNEEENLPRCLGSVKDLFDEIIIVDTGSTDKTKEIAKSFNARLFDFVWINDFSAARNFSFSKASSDYIMWLDADDELDENNLNKLKKLKVELNGKTDAYMIKYAYGVNEAGEPAFVFYRERIVKNDKTFFWIDPVHEIIVPHGKIEHKDITIFHKKNHDAKDRNIKIFEKLIADRKQLTPRQKFYYGRELKDNKRYADCVKVLTEFLSEPGGWTENKIESCLTIAECHEKMQDYTAALKSLFFSFLFDDPRAEILCAIGNIFMILKKFRQAIFWFQLALRKKINIETGGFVLPKCYNFIPHLQLCVCYYQIGEIKKSEQENERAAEIYPNDTAIQLNRNFFKGLKQTTKK